MKIIRVCDAIIVNNNHQFLLQLRDNKNDINGSGKWGLIGGRLEKGEKPIDGLYRELKEELGISLKANLLNRIDDKGENNVYRHYIFSLTLDKQLKSLHLTEGQKVDFFSFDEIVGLETVEWFGIYDSIIKKYFNIKSYEDYKS
jgi:8-oxo-dGTP diphosphatase